MTTIGPETLSAVARVPEATPGVFASERRNGTVLRCHPVQMSAAGAQDDGDDTDDDDLADMLVHVTICPHCGARIEHTTTDTELVAIAEAIHALGHRP